MLSSYYPSEESKLNIQLNHKVMVDSLFKLLGRNRFKQYEIDAKFLSITAVISGDLNLLARSLPYVDIQMAVSLAIVAIEKEHLHLMDCLCEKIRGFYQDDVYSEDQYTNCFNLRFAKLQKENPMFNSCIRWWKGGKSIEALFYSGLDASDCDFSKGSWRRYEDLYILYIDDIINKSRVLSLFKILYYKFIYLNIESIYDFFLAANNIIFLDLCTDREF